MNKPTKSVLAVLAETDKALLELIAEWAKAGDLSGVETARHAALLVRNVIDELSPSNKRSKSQTVLNERKEGATKSDPIASPLMPTEYPRFEIRNATLYRIGWSRKRKESYSHKVPRAIASGIISTMSTLSAGGAGPFTAEQIIDRVNRDASVSIPSYQVYAVIGFLRANQLIEQVGRDGYQIPSGLNKFAQELWTRGN